MTRHALRVTDGEIVFLSLIDCFFEAEASILLHAEVLLQAEARITPNMCKELRGIE